jgi:hypothetical protein
VKNGTVWFYFRPGESREDATEFLRVRARMSPKGWMLVTIHGGNLMGGIFW